MERRAAARHHSEGRRCHSDYHRRRYGVCQWHGCEADAAAFVEKRQEPICPCGSFPKTLGAQVAWNEAEKTVTIKIKF